MSALVNRERRAKARETRRKRRAAILEAAAELFEKQPFESITLDIVGRRVGVAKGVASLHFPTKEELFLEVIRIELGAWFDAVDDRLREARKQLGKESFIDLLTDEILGRPAMTRHLCVLRSVMEQNVEILPAQNFIDWLRKRTVSTAGEIERRCSGFRAGEGIPFLRRLAAVVVGIRQTGVLSGVFQALMDEDQMAALRADPEKELRLLIGRIMP
jgi:AcrR family transcriptional regulator